MRTAESRSRSGSEGRPVADRRMRKAPPNWAGPGIAIRTEAADQMSPSKSSGGTVHSAAMVPKSTVLPVIHEKRLETIR
jgi:hypothetical protein